MARRFKPRREAIRGPAWGRDERRGEFRIFPVAGD